MTSDELLSSEMVRDIQRRVINVVDHSCNRSTSNINPLLSVSSNACCFSKQENRKLCHE